MDENARLRSYLEGLSPEERAKIALTFEELSQARASGYMKVLDNLGEPLSIMADLIRAEAKRLEDESPDE